jgi:hypothetical protein
MCIDVQRGKVLRCLVSVKGIEANLDKISAIVHIKPLQSKKSSEAHRQNNNIELIHVEASKAKLTILHCT